MKKYNQYNPHFMSITGDKNIPWIAMTSTKNTNIEYDQERFVYSDYAIRKYYCINFFAYKNFNENMGLI